MIKIIQKDLIRDEQFMLFDIKKLELNSYTPFDIYVKKDDGFVIIIKTGTLLTIEMHKKLSKQVKLYISTKNHSVKNLTCENLIYYVKLNLDLNRKLLDFLYKIHKKNFSYLLEEHHTEKTTQCVNNIIEAIVYIIQEKKDFIKETIPFLSDEYELETHSLHVALYAINLGNLLHFSKEKLLQIGLAGLIHDIGVKTISNEILHKNSPLETEELKLIHNHPERSVLIANHNHIHNPYIIDAIMHHHERYDGSGYPDGLTKKHITQFASILGICDVFDALTCERPYREKFSYFEALKFMIKDKSMVNKFNHQYLQSFLKSII